MVVGIQPGRGHPAGKVLGELSHDFSLLPPSNCLPLLEADQKPVVKGPPQVRLQGIGQVQKGGETVCTSDNLRRYLVYKTHHCCQTSDSVSQAAFFTGHHCLVDILFHTSRNIIVNG